MALTTLKRVILKTRQDLITTKPNLLIVAVVSIFSLLSIAFTFFQYTDSAAEITHYRAEIREHWEDRPAKHPHRMAHYGYLVFRMAHPLSIFDNGLDDYLGNVIFLEAHKQNSANLSEAGSSGTLVRFGAFTSAFLLQYIVPLILIFLGFGLIAKEREDATLKILSIQGASNRAIIWGKILGFWQFSLLFLFPVFVLIALVMLWDRSVAFEEVAVRICVLLLSYLLYYFVICTMTVVVSAISKKAASSLVTLIGSWLFMVIFLPKGIQFAAQNLYPASSRIAFETELEKDILKAGNSHNPDDPHFKHIKDSLLAHYKVKTKQELPFNYSGFVMQEGEKISSAIYIKHHKQLETVYGRQQKISELSGFADPAMAIKNLSMTASGTDYFSYRQFQEQAEEYRYKMAQHLNRLQIEQISNIKPEKGGPPAIINSENWRKFPDFNYQYTSFGKSLAAQYLPAAALIFWFLLCIAMAELTSRKLKLI